MAAVERILLVSRHAVELRDRGLIYYQLLLQLATILRFIWQRFMLRRPRDSPVAKPLGETLKKPLPVLVSSATRLRRRSWACMSCFVQVRAGIEAPTN